jgi:hypothetical protein
MQTDKRKPNEQEEARRDIDRENKNVASAYEEASKDIEQDPDLSIHSPNDDLDEAESARLGEKTDLI